MPLYYLRGINMQFGAYRKALVAVTTTTAGGALSIPNPEGVDVIITRAVLYIPTPSAGAATVDLGVAANGTTSADNLIDGVSVAAAGVFDNLNQAGTNGKATRIWGASQYVTATASATLAGIVGYLYLEYLRTA